MFLRELLVRHLPWNSHSPFSPDSTTSYSQPAPVASGKRSHFRIRVMNLLREQSIKFRVASKLSHYSYVLQPQSPRQYLTKCKTWLKLNSTPRSFIDVQRDFSPSGRYFLLYTRANIFLRKNKSRDSPPLLRLFTGHD